MLIDSLSYGGRGVGRRGDGKVVFVPMALPGDQVRVSIEREYSSYCIGRVTEILRSSPHRVEPGCPYFTECGGCDWQHLSYSEQLRWKETILRQELSKIAHIDLPGSIEVTPSKMEYGYRGHATLQCSNDPEPALGFFRKGSKSVVGIECCAVLRPRVQEIASQAREILHKTPFTGSRPSRFTARRTRASSRPGAGGISTRTPSMPSRPSTGISTSPGFPSWCTAHVGAITSSDSASAGTACPSTAARFSLPAPSATSSRPTCR